METDEAPEFLGTPRVLSALVFDPGGIGHARPSRRAAAVREPSQPGRDRTKGWAFTLRHIFAGAVTSAFKVNGSGVA